MFSKCIFRVIRALEAHWWVAFVPPSLASLCGWQLSCFVFTLWTQFAFLLRLSSVSVQKLLRFAALGCFCKQELGVYTEVWEQWVIWAWCPTCYTYLSCWVPPVLLSASPSLPIWLYFALATVSLGHGLRKYLYDQESAMSIFPIGSRVSLPLLASSEPTFGILGRKGQNVGGKRAAQLGAPMLCGKICPCSMQSPRTFRECAFIWKGVFRGIW